MYVHEKNCNIPEGRNLLMAGTVIADSFFRNPVALPSADKDLQLSTIEKIDQSHCSQKR